MLDDSHPLMGVHVPSRYDVWSCSGNIPGCQVDQGHVYAPYLGPLPSKLSGRAPRARFERHKLNHRATTTTLQSSSCSCVGWPHYSRHDGCRPV